MVKFRILSLNSKQTITFISLILLCLLDPVNSARRRGGAHSRRQSRQKQQSHQQTYVTQLLNELGLETTPENSQRAKYAYEHVLKQHMRELHTRKSSSKPKYAGHVKSSKRSSRRCKVNCHNERALNNVNDLSYETLDVGPRRARSTSVIFDERSMSLRSMVDAYDNLLRIDNKIAELHDKKTSRRTREVFNIDTRFDIQGSHQNKFPFSSVVRLSTGCSGVVIHPTHVLTAAHCVHDGSTYVKGAKRLRVGRPRKQSKVHGLRSSERDNNRAFKWYKVKLVHFPKEWIKENPREETMIEYDYALVVLRKPIASFPDDKRSKSRRGQVMKVGIAPIAQNLRMNRLHFSNFDFNDATKMKYRFCPVENESADLYYNFCDSSRGSSGGGIYAKVPKVQTSGDITTSLANLQDMSNFERRVIATFSGHQYIKSTEGTREYNVGVKITPLKYTQICYWILKNEDTCKNTDDAIYATTP